MQKRQRRTAPIIGLAVPPSHFRIDNRGLKLEFLSQIPLDVVAQPLKLRLEVILCRNEI